MAPLPTIGADHGKAGPLRPGAQRPGDLRSPLHGSVSLFLPALLPGSPETAPEWLGPPPKPPLPKAGRTADSGRHAPPIASFRKSLPPIRRPESRLRPTPWGAPASPPRYPAGKTSPGRGEAVMFTTADANPLAFSPVLSGYSPGRHPPVVRRANGTRAFVPRKP
ncbi:hypothetical protein GCM10027160_13900 [Streptomyces calidiresistens]